MKNKEYSTCFSTTKVYGNYAAPLFINTIEMPTIKSVVVYNGYNGTDILNEVRIDDYHSNNFTLKCSNDICAGSVVVVTFN